MHWAETITEANEIIAQLIAQKKGKTVVKGKSMVSEETALNDYLEQRNVECLESDMGEYIVQLAKQHPSHIIMPAIHQNKQQVAQLFADNIDGFEYSTDVDTLIQQGRDNTSETNFVRLMLVSQVLILLLLKRVPFV